ncbi:oxidized low-density lipoprotein receptor 1-like [Hypanus sabinus]|uniref:oxidized low-density lipoprotein receptor 1-like n=1 Tax=Hypanus sabinus TaxID=79690 RepID=UPI0028C3D213|nr:oxidized low-density lipoprotein receptor 1-like [Hypanus sabinus]
MSLLSMVTSVFFLTVVGLSIHVSQIRQSKVTCKRTDNELNSTLQSMVSALNSNLSVLQQKHSDLRHQFCGLLTSRREEICSKDLVRYGDRCYLFSTFEISYNGARLLCSNIDSMLLEINSQDEANFIEKAVHDQGSSYWIGKCEDGEVALNVVYNVNAGKSECSKCKSSCKNDQYRFICEKSAPFCPDISEKVRNLCQQPVEPT